MLSEYVQDHGAVESSASEYLFVFYLLRTPMYIFETKSQIMRILIIFWSSLDYGNFQS